MADLTTKPAQAIARAGEQSWGDEGREFWDFVAAAKKRGLVAPLSSRGRGLSPSADSEQSD